MILFQKSVRINNNMEENISLQILSAIQSLSGEVKQLSVRFDGIEQRIDGLEKRFVGLEQRISALEARMDDLTEAIQLLAEQMEVVSQRLDRLETRVSSVEARLTRVESQMVTKSYLDEKLFALRGDLVAMIRHTDGKTGRLITALAKKDVLKKFDIEYIQAEEQIG